MAKDATVETMRVCHESRKGGRIIIGDKKSTKQPAPQDEAANVKSVDEGKDNVN